MTFDDWKIALDRLLRSANAGFSIYDIDDKAMANAFAAGVSPVVFSKQAAAHLKPKPAPVAPIPSRLRMPLLRKLELSFKTAAWACWLICLIVPGVPLSQAAAAALGQSRKEQQSHLIQEQARRSAEIALERERQSRGETTQWPSEGWDGSSYWPEMPGARAAYSQPDPERQRSERMIASLNYPSYIESLLANAPLPLTLVGLLCLEAIGAAVGSGFMLLAVVCDRMASQPVP